MHLHHLKRYLKRYLQRTRRTWILLITVAWVAGISGWIAPTPISASEPPSTAGFNRIPKLAQADPSIEPSPANAGSNSNPLSPAQLQQQAYVESCGECHLALPAEVMPSETWRSLLQDPDHYGQQITLPVGTTLQLSWEYLRSGSRPLIETELVPFRLAESRYFQALHPQVEFPNPIRASSCIDCHPGANQGNFVNLTLNWE